MRLEYKLPIHLDIFGKHLWLNLTFDTVLRVYGLLGEDVLDADKTDVTLRLLVRNYRTIRRMPLYQKAQIFEAIFQQFIVSGKKNSDDGKKHMDFKQDADYIYASFLLDYGVDLIEQQRRLDWRKFMAMLSGLSSHTKIRDVMAIRAAEIPSPTEHNGKQIQELIKAKQHYALDVSAEEAEDNIQSGLAQLGAMLLAQTKR